MTMMARHRETRGNVRCLWSVWCRLGTSWVPSCGLLGCSCGPLGPFAAGASRAPCLCGIWAIRLLYVYSASGAVSEEGWVCRASGFNVGPPSRSCWTRSSGPFTWDSRRRCDFAAFRHGLRLPVRWCCDASMAQCRMAPCGYVSIARAVLWDWGALQRRAPAPRSGGSPARLVLRVW